MPLHTSSMCTTWSGELILEVTTWARTSIQGVTRRHAPLLDQRPLADTVATWKMLAQQLTQFRYFQTSTTRPLRDINPTFPKRPYEYKVVSRPGIEIREAGSFPPHHCGSTSLLYTVFFVFKGCCVLSSICTSCICPDYMRLQMPN